MSKLLDSFNALMLAELTGGLLQGSPEAPILRARADSRICRQGDLFVALPGEKLDGSQFIADAWNNGATVVLAKKGGKLPKPVPGKALVLVEDTHKALLRVATALRNAAPDLEVVGITGSNGKTTTKNILAAIMIACHGDKVLVSPGNYNSDIGLPLTLFDLRSRHRYAIIEMGMNRVGEIKLLAELIRPRVGVITNIGMAHVGKVGSLEAIAREKMAILSGADSAIIWEDEPWKDFLVENFPGQVRYFGKWKEKGWTGFKDRGLDGSDIQYKGSSIHFALVGEHNLRNAMAAAEAGIVLGVSDSAVKAGLESVRPATGRCEVNDGRVTIVDDCYNANPESMMAALEFFSNLSSRGRHIAVLGEMLELGHECEAALQKAGMGIARFKPDAVFLLGDSLSIVEEVLQSEHYNGYMMRYSSMEQLGHGLAEYVRTGDAVLLKGSRMNAMERVKDFLM